MYFKKILIITINCICLWLALKVILNYYTEYHEKQTGNPIKCTIIEKDCKYSRATSHCNILFEGKKYRVPINNCDSLKIGENKTQFYYNKSLNYIFDKDYLEIKFLIVISFMFALILFLTVRNWKKI